jgi:serine/threonine-protein kinase
VPDALDRLKAALADRYLVERELGAGGMATVYLAHDPKHERQVAIKVLRPELAAVLGAERFVQEIKTTASLQHPHILPLHDSGSADGFLYYVMPFVEGETLRDRLDRERQLPIEDALLITRTLADALNYAHSLGVIHRDIKPENILFASGHAVIADFGIARAISEAGGARLTETGMALGTPAYMSPEQGAGETQLDARSDLYSLACVLYEMLTASLRVVREAVSEPMERVIRKALAKLPADRYATMQQFSEALAAVPIAAEEPGLARRVRFRPRALVAAMVAAVLLTMGGWWVVNGRGSDGIQSLAVLPLVKLGGDTAQVFLVDGMQQELISQLSRIGALTVRPRISVMRYRGTDKSIPEIGRELGVEAVVVGSATLGGESIRLQVELIATDPEQHIWGDTYDRTIRDLPALNTEVARNIAAEIEATLTPEEAERLAQPQLPDPRAYQAYLLGQYHLWQLSHESLQRATTYFEEAIALDPTYAPAYVELATTYTFRGNWWGDLTPVEAFPPAQTAAERALRLDSTLAEAHALLGTIRFNFNWDWVGAEAEYKRALKLSPNAASSHGAYANFLRAMKRFDEALLHAERWVELDPVVPIAWGQLYLAYSDANQPDRAAEAFERGVELDPSDRTTQLVLGLERIKRTDFDGAVEALMAAGLPEYAAGAAALAGNEDQARDLLKGLYQRPKPPSAGIARVHATLGDTAEAIEWLERAYREREADMVFLDYWELEWFAVGRALWELRSEPRVEAVFQKINFPDSLQPSSL